MGKQSSQLQLERKAHWKFRYSHGGALRNRRSGRVARPLSTKAPIHLVFKTNRKTLKRGLRSPLGHKIVTDTLKKYSRHFFVKIEQVSINTDHIHLLIRLSRRSLGQHFFRVVAGQIAQDFLKNGMLKAVTGTPTSTPTSGTITAAHTPDLHTTPRMWKHRPFTRVIQGWKPYQVVRNYIKLNEKEAAGVIKYKPDRLKGLSNFEWELLWT